MHEGRPPPARSLKVTMLAALVGRRERRATSRRGPGRTARTAVACLAVVGILREWTHPRRGGALAALLPEEPLSRCHCRRVKQDKRLLTGEGGPRKSDCVLETRSTSVCVVGCLPQYATPLTIVYSPAVSLGHAFPFWG